MNSLADSVRRRDHDRLLRALIEEAWRRARRRRQVYAGGALSIAVLGAIVFSTLHGPAESPTGPPAVVPGSSAQASSNTQAPRFLAAEHVTHGVFHLVGKHGAVDVAVRFSSSGRREWDVIHGRPLGAVNTGQYALMVGGGGRVEARGHADTWNARLIGYVRSPKQRVVIELEGRPTGTFVITPTQPGNIKRDSGTQRSGWLG